MGVRWMAAMRSLVGTMSWNVTYRVEVRETDRTREGRFFHTLPHSAFGHFLTIHKLQFSGPLLDMWCKYRICAVCMPSSPRVAVVGLSRPCELHTDAGSLELSGSHVAQVGY